jgi:cation transport ATPase
MEKTLFYVKAMDCPAEEQMVRMNLADIPTVKQLSFDLDQRNLTVYHEGELERITAAIKSLNFGEQLIETAAYTGKIETENDTTDKKLLWTVLIINFSSLPVKLFLGFSPNQWDWWQTLLTNFQTLLCMG